MRFIDSGLISPELSLAREAAILGSRAASESPDTLHIYKRDRPMISVGRFQDLVKTIDVEAADARGVRVLRRMSGGSSIYTDPNQLIYSITMGKEAYDLPREESFRLICGGLIESLTAMGIAAEHKPVNDILVNGMKISGSAQVRKRGVLMQQGTLIMSLDQESMDAVLRPVKRRSYGRLTSLEENACSPTWKELGMMVMEGFQKALGVDMEKGHLTESEIEMENLEMERIRGASCSSPP